MKIIPILILSIFLTGCACFKKEENVPVTPKTVHIDAAALANCSKLPEDVLLTSFEQFLDKYSDLALKYADCANKQSNSVKLLKEFGNIKD